MSVPIVVVQVLKGIRAKSFRVEVNACEVRVCGMKVLMQPVNPSDSRLTLPSINSLVSIFATLFPEPSRQTQPPQGTGPGPMGVAPFVTALTASVGIPGALIGGQAVAPGKAKQKTTW